MGDSSEISVPLMMNGGGGGGGEYSRRPKEPWKGEFVKSIVYAGMDSIVTSFSLISSISAGHLSSGN